MENTEQLSDHELHVRHHVYAIMSRYQDQAFEALDKLHQRNIHDNDVIKALRDGDYKSEADAYIEWSGAIDPDVDPTPDGPELVTDPGTNESDIQMRQALEREVKRQLQAQAWEMGMGAAKLAAQGIKPARNPFTTDSAVFGK